MGGRLGGGMIVGVDNAGGWGLGVMIGGLDGRRIKQVGILMKMLISNVSYLIDVFTSSMCLSHLYLS